MTSTDIKPCAVNIPVSAHITFHYKPVADKSSSSSSSCSSSAAASGACSPRGSSAGLPPALSTDNEIIEAVLNVSGPVAADITPFKSNYTAASRLTSDPTSPSALPSSRRNSVVPASDFHQCAHHKNFQRRASEPQLPSFSEGSASEMTRSISYAQHSMMIPISDEPAPQTPASSNGSSDPSCSCNRHHHRRNSVAVKFDKPLYKRLES
ncbi:YNR014W-like protein [Saccharomyces cerevisiae x Saccharomyces kudriavzevii VIN7]|uniref:YNR014W-like protein n=1 Tax=Saccharomyces cerevisiae x Saccharomyces kudriavzevii (strain VIN7) TaxID=1095631 RepID=H0H0H5_SACCK|nr:YNR014W-like protein [Saccharomyces cerevisiae x Saccharomyces kudriavzevii VIN7]